MSYDWNIRNARSWVLSIFLDGAWQVVVVMWQLHSFKSMKYPIKNQGKWNLEVLCFGNRLDNLHKLTELYWQNNLPWIQTSSFWGSISLPVAWTLLWGEMPCICASWPQFLLFKGGFALEWKRRLTSRICLGNKAIRTMRLRKFAGGTFVPRRKIHLVNCRETLRTRVACR